jgi:hypothetical protein
MRILKLVACLAWAGVAVSSAAPADALAFAYANGNYASCASASETIYPMPICATPYGYTYVVYYSQQIKIVQTGCSTGGGCNSDAGGVYVDFLYPTGRKVVQYTDTCMDGWTMFELGTCAC